MARLLADENFPFPVIEVLRRLGQDIVSLSDLGKAGQGLADQAVLDLASGDKRGVLTLNRRDFVRLHREAPNHAGIVVCTLDLDFDGQAERIQAALGGQATIDRRLIRVNRSTPKSL